VAVFFPIRIFRRQRRRQRWSPPSRVIVHRTMPAAVGTLTLAGQAVTLTKTTAAAGTTLDPAKTSSFITLSNSNRTATRSTGTAAYVTTLSTKSGVTAELYVEATNTAGVDSGIGVSNAPMADSDSGGTINWLGWNGNSIGLYRDSIYLNGALVDSLPTTPNATDVIAAFSEDLVGKRDDRIRRQEYARLDVSIVAPNRIEIQTARVQRYSLFLNEQLIDSSKPLVVLTNGQVSFEGLVTPSIETLLRQARLRQDSQQLFSIRLAVQVRKQP